jgi:hypothetical protein
MKTLSKIPFTLILTISWLFLNIGGIDLSASSPFGLSMISLAFIVYMIEFYKSGDIMLRSFMLDLAYAILNLIIVTCYMTIIIKSGFKICAIDVMISMIALTDIWLSPVNGYRTALRNLSTDISMASE